jgi:hypothetical protein
MSEMREPRARQPFRVRLPGFLEDEEVGLGEVIRRATSIAGVRPCGGCARRAAQLDQWLVFAPGNGIGPRRVAEGE